MCVSCFQEFVGYNEGFPDAEAMFVPGNKTLFSGPEAPWHGSACVRTAKPSHRQNRWLHPNSLQGPRLVPACTLAGHRLGCPGLTHAKDLSDDLVADRELVLRPWFCLRFALCCRLKPQVSHGEACSGLRGGSVSGRVPRGRLPSLCSAVQADGTALTGPAGLTARGKLA